MPKEMPMKRRDFVQKGAISCGGSGTSFENRLELRCRISHRRIRGSKYCSTNRSGQFRRISTATSLKFERRFYDGIWVGEKSKAEHQRVAQRTDRAHAQDQGSGDSFSGRVLCDSYDWRDGIGPAEKRPRRTNFWNGVESEKSPASHKYDPNAVGTTSLCTFAS